MVTSENVDIDRLQLGISQAALKHNARLDELQVELAEAYKRELEAAVAIAERKQFSAELYTTRKKLDAFKKKLELTERKLALTQRSLVEQEKESTRRAAEMDKQILKLSLTLEYTQNRWSALSNSRLGAWQLKYWRWRNGKGQA